MLVCPSVLATAICPWSMSAETGSNSPVTLNQISSRKWMDNLMQSIQQLYYHSDNLAHVAKRDMFLVGVGPCHQRPVLQSSISSYPEIFRVNSGFSVQQRWFTSYQNMLPWQLETCSTAGYVPDKRTTHMKSSYSFIFSDIKQFHYSFIVLQALITGQLLNNCRYTKFGHRLRLHLWPSAKWLGELAPLSPMAMPLSHKTMAYLLTFREEFMSRKRAKQRERSGVQ